MMVGNESGAIGPGVWRIAAAIGICLFMVSCSGSDDSNNVAESPQTGDRVEGERISVADLAQREDRFPAGFNEDRKRILNSNTTRRQPDRFDFLVGETIAALVVYHFAVN